MQPVRLLLHALRSSVPVFRVPVADCSWPVPENMKEGELGKSMLPVMRMKLVAETTPESMRDRIGAEPCCSYHALARRCGGATRSSCSSLKCVERTSAKLTLEDLVDQTVHDVAVVAGEGPDQPRHILVALPGQRG